MLNQCWVNVGPPSVSLAHIQRGAQHDTVTQYWVNVGSASRQWLNISPTLGERLVFDAFTIESAEEKLMGDSQTETDRADRGTAICPHLWVHRGDIINKLYYFSRNHDFKIWLSKGLTSREYLIQVFKAILDIKLLHCANVWSWGASHAGRYLCYQTFFLYFYRIC